MFTLTKSGQENLVSSLKRGDVSAPRIATTSNGEFRIVWDANEFIGEQKIGPNGAVLGIETSIFDQGMTKIPLDGSATFTIIPTIGADYHFVNSSGNFYGGILYQNFGSPTSSSVTRVVDFAGTEDGGVLLLLRHQSYNLRNFAPPTDTSQVVRIDSLGRKTEVQLAATGSDLFALLGGGFAVAEPSVVAVYGADGKLLTNLTVEAGLVVTGTAITGQGRYVVVGEVGGEVYQQLFGVDGLALGGRTVINTATAGLQGGSSVTTLTDGSYVIGWTDGDAWVRLYNPDGTAATDQVRVEAGGTFEQTALVLKANPIGGFVATWLESTGSGVPPSSLKTQAFVTGQIGSAGADTLTGGAGGERVDGGDGSDLLSLGGGDDQAIGGSGDDTLSGGSGADTLTGGLGNDRLDGGAGFDFADFRGSATGVRADITGLSASGEGNDQLLLIEGVYGSSGNDTLVGNYLSNNLFGFAGDDVIDGQSANNYLDGGDGTDTLVLFGAVSDYFVQATTTGGWTVSGPIGTSTVFGFERAQIGSVTLNWSDFVSQAFNGLRYVASNTDLIARFGSDAVGARQHYTGTGQAEGRSLTTFDPLRYAASNPDLLARFGTDTQALTRHYTTEGFAAGRSATSFDPLQYGAANADLLRAFGADLSALSRHYAVTGVIEGRSAKGFDPLLYGASNDDLARLFGSDKNALFNHWIKTGALEDRPSTTFDGLQYAAANSDLARLFGTDAGAAMNHYLRFGADDGRPQNGFDAVAYLLSYADLATSGGGVQGAFTHWLTVGADEMRRSDEFFGREQKTHLLDADRSARDALQNYTINSRSYADKDWFSTTFQAGERVVISVRGAGTGNGTLVDPLLQVYDSLGRLVALDDNGGSNLNAKLNFTAGLGGQYYLVVSSSVTNFTQGSYEISVTPASAAAADPGWVF